MTRYLHYLHLHSSAFKWDPSQAGEYICTVRVQFCEDFQYVIQYKNTDTRPVMIKDSAVVYLKKKNSLNITNESTPIKKNCFLIQD